MAPAFVGDKALRHFDHGLIAAESGDHFDVFAQIGSALPGGPSNLALMAIEHLEFGGEGFRDVHIDFRLKPETAQWLHQVKGGYFGKGWRLRRNIWHCSR